VLRRGLKLVAAGLALGLAGALAATRLMSAALFGVHARDPQTLAAVALLVLAAAWLACYLPARRAAKVDPMVALRCE
jgi:ABC-type lipoprotein release transport system permease subunit